jgi:hypothetical protein
MSTGTPSRHRLNRSALFLGTVFMTTSVLVLLDSVGWFTLDGTVATAIGAIVVGLVVIVATVADTLGTREAIDVHLDRELDADDRTAPDQSR